MWLCLEKDVDKFSVILLTDVLQVKINHRCSSPFEYFIHMVYLVGLFSNVLTFNKSTTIFDGLHSYRP